MIKYLKRFIQLETEGFKFLKNVIQFKLNQKKMNEVLEFIRVLLGPRYKLDIEPNKTSITIKTGPCELNRFIYSAGDCARFAKILVTHFAKYKPKILLIRYKLGCYAEDDSLWQHAVVDFGYFYADAKGIYTKNNAEYNFTIEDSYHIKRLDVPVLNGEITSIKILSEGVVGSVPNICITFENLNTDKPTAYGVVLTQLNAYKNLLDDIKDISVEEFLSRLNKIKSNQELFDLPEMCGGFIRA